MRRWAFLLSMLAALTGTPLRQAEAASDLARSFAEMVQDANLELPDGGVGDDSGVGTLTASHGAAVDVAADLGLHFFLPPPATTVATSAAEEGLQERVWWPQAPPTLRFAWLQTFRF